ncbi:hypothetical protein RCL1_006457 [Eukaryota sp. TZLM3-RCL]
MKPVFTLLKYLTTQDLRILTAIEMGMKNHALVPTELIERISGYPRGIVNNSIKNVLKVKLISHENVAYDGYTLNYSGYDVLALNTLCKAGVISSMGSQIGVGKEADIFLALDPNYQEIVVKIHRLGRTSFRAVKNKRNYLGNRKNTGWLYLSRLSAEKESCFMSALLERNFRVPKLLGQNRHVIVMEKVNGFPLNDVNMINEPPGVEHVFEQVVKIMVDTLNVGLVHGDYNEFNLIVGQNGDVTMIDFPQMVDIADAEAEGLFIHDLNECVRFFRERFGYVANVDTLPKFSELKDEILSRRDSFIVVANSNKKLKQKKRRCEGVDNVEQDGNQEENEDDNEEQHEEVSSEHSGNEEEHVDEEDLSRNFEDECFIVADQKFVRTQLRKQKGNSVKPRNFRRNFR